jgi:hypothetical protein
MDPVSSIAFGVGQLFGFLDSVIYSPQEQKRDKLTAESLRVQRQQIESNERLARMASENAKQQQQTMIGIAVIVSAAIVGAVVLRG